MDGKSLDIAQDKLEKLKEILPEAFSEGKLDIEKLRLALGEDIAIQDERYVLNWAGKGDAFRALQTPTTATLAPARDESVNFDETENIFIEGENLEVLKVLQKSYYGKVKMIYIDPPYNTGSDSFVYPDKFSESREDYLKRIQAKDEEGNLLREGQFRSNSKDSGHYHSNWLSMMYPRLFLARNLLREDGVIFISIDDNEVHNLRLLMNSVFGEENFIGQVIVQSNPRGSQSVSDLANVHEYILIFAKQNSLFEMHGKGLSQQMKDEYKYTHTDGRNYRLLGLRQRGGAWRRKDRPSLYFPIWVDTSSGEVSLTKSDAFSLDVWPIKPTTGEEGSWRWSKSKIEKNTNFVLARKVSRGDAHEWDIYQKDFLESQEGVERKTKAKTIWTEKGLNYQNARTEIKELFNGEDVFDFPKPVFLVGKIIEIVGVETGDIVLDFFSGSASTAHAVFLRNLEDNRKRKFICIQLPEKTENEMFPTISEIGKERIRRVIEKIKSENPMFSEQNQDLGFKVLKLKHSNFKLWRGDGIDDEEELGEQLEMLTDPVMQEAQEENMLTELLLKSGFMLTTSIQKKVVEDTHYWWAEANEEATLAVALHKLDTTLVDEIIKAKPQKFICLDRLFESDQLKTNTQLQCKDAGIVFHAI